MIGLFFIMLILAGVGAALNAKNREERPPVVVVERCKRHDWAYHPVSEGLVCTVCNQIAGE